MTQICNKKLNKIRIHQFDIFLHICQKYALFIFQKLSVLAEKFSPDSFQKIVFPDKISAKTDERFKSYDFYKKF